MKDMTRREFAKSSVAALAGLASLSVARCAAAAQKIDEIGLQVYTIRDAMAEDWRAALQRVADIGYDAIESGTLYGGSVETHLAVMKELGLKNISGGGDMTSLQEGLQETIDISLQVGRKYVVCYWPWSETITAETPDAWLKVAEQLNAFGKACKAHDLILAYHNHDIEFDPQSDIQAYDILFENTDPDLVKFEIDLYWVKKGGADPAHYLQKYPGRFPLWHVKDMADDEKQSFACVGEGVIDFVSLFKLAEVAGLEHIFVEQDQPKDSMACIETSFNYLSRLRY